MNLIAANIIGVAKGLSGENRGGRQRRGKKGESKNVVIVEKKGKEGKGVEEES